MVVRSFEVSELYPARSREGWRTYGSLEWGRWHEPRRAQRPWRRRVELAWPPASGWSLPASGERKTETDWRRPAAERASAHAGGLSDSVTGEITGSRRADGDGRSPPRPAPSRQTDRASWPASDEKAHSATIPPFRHARYLICDYHVHALGYNVR